MEFEWDAEKSEQCFAERGFDFAFVTHAFLDEFRQVRVDHRWDYGETRHILHGKIDNRLFVVVFTRRAGKTRIISARKANRREVADYERRNRGNRSR